MQLFHYGIIIILVIFIMIPTSQVSAYDSTIPWKITIKTSSGVNSTSFWPPELHARQNETIEWINNDTVAHTVTSGVLDHPSYVGKIFDSGVINPGGNFSLKIPADMWSGYYYFCKIHPWMSGKIDVGTAYLGISPDFSIETDKESYSPGDSIRIAGIANNTYQITPVTIQVFDSQRNLVYTNKTNLFSDNSFLYEFEATNAIFKTSDNYKIKSFFGFPATITDMNISFNNTQPSSATSTQDTHYTPHWLKNNAAMWTTGKITDNEFINLIQYLIKNKYMSTYTQNVSKINSGIIPTWIKNKVEGWSNNTVSDEEFAFSIQYLVTHKIIQL
ncbi:MAG: cupredoxin domain-containing protein [Nitrosotalea sp.]